MLMILLNAAPPAHGQRTASGIEHGFWEDRAVVVARIAEVHGKRSSPQVAIDVVAVAATDFLIPVRLTLDPVVLGPGSAMLSDFPYDRGDVLLLCVHKKGGGWILTGEYMAFFDSHTEIVHLKAADDPALGPMLEKVFETRKKYIDAEVAYRNRSPIPN